MFRIKISVNDLETLDDLRGLSVDAYVDAWAEAVMRLARKNAREKLGGSFGGRIAASVTVGGSGSRRTVETGGDGTEGYIGEAVHRGGLFRARSGKRLAVPIDASVKKGGANYGIFPRLLPAKGVPIFAARSKRGNDLLFTYTGTGKTKGIRPLFVLKDATRHAPRPWWPEPDEVEAETAKFFDENF